MLPQRGIDAACTALASAGAKNVRYELSDDERLVTFFWDVTESGLSLEAGGKIVEEATKPYLSGEGEGQE